MAKWQDTLKDLMSAYKPSPSPLDSVIGTTLGYLGNKSNSKDAASVGAKLKNTDLQAYDTSSYGSSGGGSGYNLSGVLSAYDQSAAADRALAQQVYDTKVRNLNTALDRARDSYNVGVSNTNNAYNLTADNLRRSLERYQADNKRFVENQKRSYLADQASLEDARFQADRQTRIDAASRGLGGSGLQQLAQLQNLISQGNDISKLALENQGVMDDLRTDLANYTEDNEAQLRQAQQTRDTSLANLLTTLNYAEQDNTTGLQDALLTYQNTINKINADLANSKASVRSAYGSSSAASEDYADTIAGVYGSLEQQFETDLKELYSGKGSDKKKKEDAMKLYNNYLRDSAGVYGSYGNKYRGLQNTNLSNLSAILNKYIV